MYGLCSLQIKATFSCEVTHTQETMWQSVLQSCNMPGLPTHLVQELNVGTIGNFSILKSHLDRGINSFMPAAPKNIFLLYLFDLSLFWKIFEGNI